MIEAITRRATTTLAAALLLSTLGAGTATAAPEADPEQRMHLYCENGLTIMRSNGSSWWGVHEGQADGTVYVTRELEVQRDGEVVYRKSYGNKNPHREEITCEAEHFGFDGSVFEWSVTMVRTA